MRASKMACVVGMRAVISSSASFSWYNHTVFEFNSFLFPLFPLFFCLPVTTHIPCSSETEVRHEPWDISCLGEGYGKLLPYYYPLPLKSYEICKTYLASLPPSSIRAGSHEMYVRVWTALDFNMNLEIQTLNVKNVCNISILLLLQPMHNKFVLKH
jgi:hypothetical protein